RRAPLRAAGAYRFHGSGGITVDYEMYCRLAVKGLRFATHPECLLRYRVHPEATKVAKLRDQIRNTIRIKEMYWKDQMDTGARIRLAAERILLVLPPTLVLRLFMLLNYRPKPRPVPAGNR
ncbi:MAG: hypothetical protein ACREQ9_24785, partial [Candidatus Binatia bacterium]